MAKLVMCIDNLQNHSLNGTSIEPGVMIPEIK